ncbi:MAG: GNAT family N-acetyltransferase [Pseudomonadota bacterium]
MPHTIRTERFVLQPMGLRHARALWHEVRDYEVLRNTSLWPHPLSYAHTVFMVSKLKAMIATDPVFAVIKDGELTGSIGLHERQKGVFTIGYMLGRRFWGQGIASEIVPAVCSFGFRQLRIDHILAEVYVDNIGSERVLTKHGFRRRPGTTMGYSTARGHGFPITTWDLTVGDLLR